MLKLNGFTTWQSDTWQLDEVSRTVGKSYRWADTTLTSVFGCCIQQLISWLWLWELSGVAIEIRNQLVSKSLVFQFSSFVRVFVSSQDRLQRSQFGQNSPNCEWHKSRTHHPIGSAPPCILQISWTRLCKEIEWKLWTALPAIFAIRELAESSLFIYFSVFKMHLKYSIFFCTLRFHSEG